MDNSKNTSIEETIQNMMKVAAALEKVGKATTDFGVVLKDDRITRIIKEADKNGNE